MTLQRCSGTAFVKVTMNACYAAVYSDIMTKGFGCPVWAVISDLRMRRYRKMTGIWKKIIAVLCAGALFAAMSGMHVMANNLSEDDTRTRMPDYDTMTEEIEIPVEYPLPEIQVQPESCKQVAGKKVKLSVTATGDNLSYQWESLKPGSAEWKKSGLTSAKTATLSFTMTEKYDGMQYRCVVKNEYDKSVISDAATITLGALPVITKQPESVRYGLGVAAKIPIAAEGDGLTYQWQFMKPGTTSWKRSGLSSATTATLKFKVSIGYDGMKFRCIVTNADGFSVTSEEASVTVLEGPSIVLQPSNVNAAEGMTVKLTTQASGNGLTYQWQLLKAGTTTWKASGLASAATATLSFKMSSGYDGMSYRCKVTDADKIVAYTDTVVVKLVEGPVITKQPVDVTTAIGTKATFSIQATGDDLTYQWQYQKPGKTTWSNATSAGNQTDTFKITLNSVTNGMKFRCVVTNGQGIVSYSKSVTLTAE